MSSNVLQHSNGTLVYSCILLHCDAMLRDFTYACSSQITQWFASCLNAWPSVQYPSDARYKAKAFHTQSQHVSHDEQRVSHAERTRFARGANTFLPSCECVSQTERLYFIFMRKRFTHKTNAFTNSCTHVSHVNRTRLSFCVHGFCARRICVALSRAVRYTHIYYFHSTKFVTIL